MSHRHSTQTTSYAYAYMLWKMRKHFQHSHFIETQMQVVVWLLKSFDINVNFKGIFFCVCLEKKTDGLFELNVKCQMKCIVKMIFFLLIIVKYTHIPAIQLTDWLAVCELRWKKNKKILSRKFMQIFFFFFREKIIIYDHVWWSFHF